MQMNHGTNIYVLKIKLSQAFFCMVFANPHKLALSLTKIQLYLFQLQETSFNRLMSNHMRKGDNTLRCIKHGRRVTWNFDSGRNSRPQNKQSFYPLNDPLLFVPKSRLVSFTAGRRRWHFAISYHVTLFLSLWIVRTFVIRWFRFHLRRLLTSRKVGLHVRHFQMAIFCTAITDHISSMIILFW
jgi:hypothetical protein